MYILNSSNPLNQIYIDKIQQISTQFFFFVYLSRLSIHLSLTVGQSDVDKSSFGVCDLTLPARANEP